MQRLIDSDKYEEGLSWLELSRHDLVRDHIDKDVQEKFERKLLLCYSKMTLHEKVLELYNAMKEENQSNTRTLCMMFEHWLQKNEEAKAREILDQMKSKGDDYSIVALAISIGKARDRGMRDLTVGGMKSVIDVISNHDKLNLQGVNVSSLIRCAIQLLLKTMTHGDDTTEKTQCLESAKMMGVILEQGLKIIRKQVSGVGTNDLMWVISKAYNSALHQSQEKNMESSLALTDMALKVGFSFVRVKMANYSSGLKLCQPPSSQYKPSSTSGKCIARCL